MNRKAGINLLFYAIAILLGFYLIINLLGSGALFGIKVPFFANLLSKINYFMLLIFWILLQITVVFCYYKLGVFIFKESITIRGKIHQWSFNLNKYIIGHR